MTQKDLYGPEDLSGIEFEKTGRQGRKVRTIRAPDLWKYGSDFCFAIYALAGEDECLLWKDISRTRVDVKRALEQGLISLGEDVDGSCPAKLTEKGLVYARELQAKRIAAAEDAPKQREEEERKLREEKERLERVSREPITEDEKTFLSDLWRICGKAGGEVEAEQWSHKYANARELFDNLKLKKYLHIWTSDFGAERFEFNVKALDLLKQRPTPTKKLTLATGEKVDLRSGAITMILAATTEILENDVQSIIFNDLSKDGATNRKVRRACVMELKRILKLRGDDLKPETCSLIHNILADPFRFVWSKSMWEPGTYLWKGETYTWHGLPDIEA